MASNWKIIDKFNNDDLQKYLIKLNSNNYVLSEWILDMFSRYNSNIPKNKFPIVLCRITVKELGFSEPTTLNKIYNNITNSNFDLVEPELVLPARQQYTEQKTGEWLRFATPFNSLIDSDGVPHLPKLGKALNKYFIETYWSYPDAIFHPHNEFVVKKSDK